MAQVDDMLESSCHISVIIPAYNAQLILQRAIEKTLNQTLLQRESIVVGDGSTDGGGDIVRRYTDPRIHLIWQENAGPGAARNRGLQESQTDYVTFLDADDEYAPDFLKKSLIQLEKHQHCDLSVSGHFRSAGEEKQDITHLWRNCGIMEGVWEISKEAYPGILQRAVEFSASGAIVCKRHVLQRYGGFYDKGRCTWGEDAYLWLQVLLNHKVFRTLEPLMWYHTEVSELWLGRTGIYPLEPILTDPEPIRKNCPGEYRAILEELLAIYAINAAERYALQGNGDIGKELFRQFPLVRQRGRDYRRVWLKIFASPIYRWVRQTPSLLYIAKKIKHFCETFKGMR